MRVQTRLRASALALLTALLAVLAACGGGGDDEDTADRMPVRCAEQPERCR
jgi:hypothetical protein